MCGSIAMCAHNDSLCCVTRADALCQTALSVASHLSCSSQHSSLGDVPLPLDELYEEAMRKQIHAHKVRHARALLRCYAAEAGRERVVQRLALLPLLSN